MYRDESVLHVTLIRADGNRMAKISIELDGQERVVVLTPGNTVPVALGGALPPRPTTPTDDRPPTLSHLDLDYLR